MTDERIDIEIGDKVSPNVRKKILELAEAARRADSAVVKLKNELQSVDTTSLNKLATASAKVTNSLARETNAAARLTSANARMTNANNRASLSQQKLATETERTSAAQSRAAAAAQSAAAATSRAELAALRLRNAQDKLSVSTQRSNRNLTGFVRTAITFAGISFGGAAVVGAADSYTILENKLRNVVETEKQLVAVTGEVFDIARRTRAPVQDTAQAFQRFDLALKQLGASQRESLELTETVNKSLILSGSTTNETSSALLQLSQAFNKGKLDGDEFRTVMELMPTVADAIAKELKVTRGELLNLAPQGKITAEVMRRAFANAREEIGERFAKTVPTLGQALTNLRTSAIQFFGELNKSLGVTEAMSRAIVLLADNFEVAALALAGLGSALAVSFAPAIIRSIVAATTAMRAFTAAIAANPIGLLAVAISTAISALIIFRDRTIEIGDTAIRVGNVLNAVWTTVSESISGTVKWIWNLLSALGNLLTLNLSGSWEDLQRSAQSLKDSGDAIYKAWSQIDKVSKTAPSFEPSNLRGTGPSVTPTDPTATTQAEKRADALARINRELNSELQLLGMLGPQREIQQRFNQINNELLNKKIILSEEERKGIMQKLELSQRENEIQAQLEQHYNSNIGQLQQIAFGLEAANRAYERGIISAEQYTNRLAELNVQAAELKIQMGDGTFADVMTASLGTIIEGYEGMLSGVTDSFGNFFNSLADGFADSIGRAVVYSENLGDALRDVARSALSELISALVKVGIQYLVNAAIGQSIGAATAATNAALAATAAVAWAPAAALASLATLGANAGPAAAAISGTMALSQGMALSSIAGFEEGGYTGNLGRKEVAGVVHGQEFVVNAAATARNRDTLEAMNNGATAVSMNSGTANNSGKPVEMNVFVENYGSSQIEVERLSETDVRIIAREEAKGVVRREAPDAVAASISNPNSTVSKSLDRNTNTQRKR